eukprot:SM000005S17295  [mRNA]  locus=s5:1282414:1285342:- [translate_table: standard]
MATAGPTRASRLPGTGALMDALLEHGAAACSVEDAHLGTAAEQEVLEPTPLKSKTLTRPGSSKLTPRERAAAVVWAQIYAAGPLPWQAPEQRQPLWQQSRLVALFPSSSDAAAALAAAATAAGLDSVPSFSLEYIANKDWIGHVQRLYRSTEVADGLWVVPSWETKLPPDPAALSILLEPGVAFGTGDHPTTRLCLRWLKSAVRRRLCTCSCCRSSSVSYARYVSLARSKAKSVCRAYLKTLIMIVDAAKVKGGEKMLDYGCGSGILSLAALKLHGSRAVGVDIDPLAVSSAMHNARLNGYAPPVFEAVLRTPDGKDPAAPGPLQQAGKWPASEADSLFDIVVANILVGPLLLLAPRLASYARPGGRIALSGILTSQVSAVTEAYGPFMVNVSFTEEDGWACIQGTRSA